MFYHGISPNLRHILNEFRCHQNIINILNKYRFDNFRTKIDGNAFDSSFHLNCFHMIYIRI